MVGYGQKPLFLQISPLLFHVPVEAWILSVGTHEVEVDSVISTMKLPVKEPSFSWNDS